MSGSLIPLAFFPKVVSAILPLLAFSSLIYTPVMIIVGKYDASQMLQALFLQFFWLLVMVGLVSVDLETSPDFLKLADAFDLKAARIDNVDDFNKAFKSFITSDESIILDCRVAREDNVLPMIPAGGTVSGMMGKKGVL